MDKYKFSCIFFGKKKMKNQDYLGYFFIFRIGIFFFWNFLLLDVFNLCFRFDEVGWVLEREG